MYPKVPVLNWVSSTCFRFRRQHEQLRAVIVRVLQPPAVSQATPAGPGAGQQQDLAEEGQPEVVLDPADANAIQEVNLAYENVKEVDGLDVSKDGSELWEAAIKRFEHYLFLLYNVESGNRDQVAFLQVFLSCVVESCLL